MAEMLASAAVKAAGAKLGGVLGGALAEELGSLWKMRGDLVFMKDTLESIQAVLKDAERRSMANNASVTLWLKRLKSAACDVEDMLEEFTALNPKEEVDGDNNCLVMVSLFCSSISPSHISMAHQIKKMRQRLQGIQAQAGIGGFNLCRDGNSHEDEVISTRDTISDINEDIVGRDTDKEQIISALLAGSGDHVTVIAIHGFGGLGKTTLAKLAFNDATVAKYFDLRAWVYVSMKYDLKKIGESILSQVDEPRSYDALEPLKQQIKKKLGDKKLLIVLDDLWEGDSGKLGALMAFLKACAEGCKVMVTTRGEQIATEMRPALSHKLEVLSGEQCWDLFKQKAFSPGEDVPAEVEKIGRELVHMCGGVPLAIRSLGSTMRSKGGVDAWERMKNSDIWKMEGEILPSLRLSFYHLPGHLKPCFAYCSVFPKGCEIDKDLLIQQWIAMGFIQSTDRTPEKLGEEYVKELMGMSFLEASRIPSFSVASKRVRTPRLFQMHDLIHDLAMSAAGEEFLLSDFGDRKNSRKNDCRYAVLANYRDGSTIFESVPGKARSLHFRNCEQLQLPKKASSLSKFLRVLDLSGCSILELPPYVTHKLKLLKFLDASYLQNPVPPEHLSSLCSLHALNLSHSTFGSLPSNIGSLSKLHYLNLRGCSHLSELPESFVQLKYLLHLDLSKCSGLYSLPIFFGNLDQLTFLDLSGCPKLRMLPDSFQHLVCLETLNLSSCHELQELPRLFGKLQKLHTLDLSDCKHLNKLPESLSEILHLEYLSLSYCHILVELPKCFGALRHLRTLNLLNCQELLVLPESFTLLENLEELILSGCWELKELPASFGNLCKLRFLDLSCCIQLSVLPESLSKLVNLKNLDLSCCAALQKLPVYFGNLKKLEVLNVSYCNYFDIPKGVADIYGLKSLLAIGMEFCFCRWECQHSRGDIQIEDLKWFYRFTDYKYVISFSEGDRPNDIEVINSTSLAVTGLSVVRSTEEVAGLELQRRQHLQQLKLGFGSDSPVDRGVSEDVAILGKLLPPRTLEQFELKGNNRIEFPFWMKSVMSYLPNLVHLRLSDLERCDYLPPLGQLPKLLGLEICTMPNLRKVGMEFSGGHKSFLRLRNLKIVDMKNLERWHISMSVAGGRAELVFPNLHSILIIGCPRLKFVPFLPQCLLLDIYNSDVVLSSGRPNAPVYSSPPIQHMSREDARLTNHAIQKLDSNNLVELSLRHLKLIDHLPPLGQLPKLRKLVIEDMPNIRQVGSDFSGGSAPFPRLRTLEIRNMRNLEEWHTTQLTNNAEEHIFPVLEELYVRACPKLRFVPFFLPSISRCSISNSDEVLLSGQYNGPPSYHMPTSELCLFGLDAKFTGLQYFTNLVEISLCHLELIDRLPPLGQLPKLHKLVIADMPNIRHVGRDFSGGSAPFPRLRTLEIWDMPELGKWHMTQSTNDAEEHIFPVLEELDVCGCPKLRFVPFLPPCTYRCSIEDSDGVFLSGQHNGPPSYHMPTSELYCSGASAGFTGLQYFTALKSLEIEDIKLEMMNSSWGESIRHLTSLESLRMRGCTVGGGEWFGALTSLRSLAITRCSLPRDFPQYVLRLTALESFEVMSCWEAIKVLSKEKVQALIIQIPKVKIVWYEWLSENYDDAGVWPTILPEWPKELEDNDDTEYEDDYYESDDDDDGEPEDDDDGEREDGDDGEWEDDDDAEPEDDDGGGRKGKRPRKVYVGPLDCKELSTRTGGRNAVSDTAVAGQKQQEEHSTPTAGGGSGGGSSTAPKLYVGPLDDRELSTQTGGRGAASDPAATSQTKRWRRRRRQQQTAVAAEAPVRAAGGEVPIGSGVFGVNVSSSPAAEAAAAEAPVWAAGGEVPIGSWFSAVNIPTGSRSGMASTRQNQPEFYAGRRVQNCHGHRKQRRQQ